TRRSAGAQISSGIHQQLESRDWATASHRLLGGHRGEIASGTVASDGDALGISTELCRVAVGEFECGECIVHGGGEAMLGRASILHRQHPHPGMACEIARYR